MALDEGRVDEASRATDAVVGVEVGPRLECWRMIVAGRVAMRRGDASSALSRFKAAAGHTRNATRFPDLAVRAGVGIAVASALQGELKQAARRLRSAATLAARHDLPSLRGRVLLRLAWLAEMGGDHAQALTDAHAGEALIAPTGNRHADLEAAQVLARLLVDQDSAAALAHSQRAAALRRALDLSSVEAQGNGRVADAEGAPATGWPIDLSI
jgi:ATP/maltotriose-dependent transcriptional regulator MalT